MSTAVPRRTRDERIGSFQRQEEIGRGSFATVYKALHTVCKLRTNRADHAPLAHVLIMLTADGSLEWKWHLYGRSYQVCEYEQAQQEAQRQLDL